MPFPFRNPVSADDEEEWTPPSYARPVTSESSSEWKPPDYAREVSAKEEEKPRRSLFSKPAPFRATKAPEDATKGIKEAKTDEEIKAEGEHPTYYDPSKREMPKKAGIRDFISSVSDAASRLAERHPKIREAIQRGLTGTSPEQQKLESEHRIRETQGPGIMAIPGLEKATDYLSQKVTGSEGTGRLLAGAGVKALGGLLEGGFDPRTAGIKEAPSIRQPQREIPAEQIAAKKTPREIPKQEDTRPLPTRSPNLDPNRFPIGEETPKVRIKSDEDIKYDAAREKFNMGRDLPVKQEEFKRVINPFGKKTKPKAEYKYDWPGIGKQYDVIDPDNVTGYHKSTVGEDRLKQLGIDIPEATESSTKELSGEERRAQAQEIKKSFGRVITQDEAAPIYHATDFNKPERVTVPTNKIVATQEGFQEPIVDDYKIHPKDEIPSASKVGDEYILNDGHHSALAQIRNGAKEIEINAHPVDMNLVENPKSYESSLEKMSKKPEWKPPEYARPIEEIPTVYHGTKSEIRNFDTSKNQSHGLFPNMTRFTENPEYSSLYSLDETPSGMKRFSEKQGNPNTIAAKIGAKNILDLTKPISSKQLEILQANFTELKGNPSSEFIQDILSRTRNPIPFDAIRYSEHGQNNWAVPNETPITTPSGLSLNKAAKNPDEAIVEMHGGLGSIGGKKKYPPSSGPEGPVLDKLFQSLLSAKESNVEQQIINKTERARRFAAFGGVKEEGASGAAKSLAKLRGEFEKAEPGKALELKPEETDSLFTAIKRAKISPGEQARGYTALFKLLNGEQGLQRNELQLLDKVFGNSFSDRITEMHGGLGAVGLKLGKISNTMKSMLNSVNLAAPILHGLPMTSHPVIFTRAAKDMLKFMANKETYNAAMKAIEERPSYSRWKEAGLFTAKPESITASEEDFANSYVGNIPGVRSVVSIGRRGYSGFLNELRSKVADNLEQNLKNMGESLFKSFPMTDKEGNYIRDVNGKLKMDAVPTKLAKDIAKYINNSTDRGSLGKLEKIAPELNYALWSPRRLTARLTMLNPIYYYKLEPFARKEALKSLFAQAAAGTSMVTLGVLAGGKTSMDPSNPDFMKVRFGDHVLNPVGPTQSIIHAAAKMIKELQRMRSGEKAKFGEQSIPEIGFNLIRNRESPIVSLADSIASAKEFTGTSKSSDLKTLSPPEAGGYVDRFGNKKYITSEIRRNFTPIFIQDVQDLLKTDQSFAESIGLAGSSFIGISEQNMPERKPKSRFRTMSSKLR